MSYWHVNNRVTETADTIIYQKSQKVCISVFNVGAQVILKSLFIYNNVCYVMY